MLLLDQATKKFSLPTQSKTKHNLKVEIK